MPLLDKLSTRVTYTGTPCAFIWRYRSSIFSLISKRNPFAIILFIIPIIIDAFYRIFSFITWAWSHIGKKVLERMPAFANNYTAAAIIFETSPIRIIATRHHCLPCYIFLGKFSTSRCAMCSGHRDLLSGCGVKWRPSVSALGRFTSVN